MKRKEDVKTKLKLVSGKWNKQRIIVRALFPLFLCLSLGLMVGGFITLVPDISYDEAFKFWRPNITKAEISNLNKSIGYYGREDVEGVDVSKVAPISFLYEFVDNMKITRDTLKNLQAGESIGEIYGREVYATDEFVGSTVKYITIVNSEDSNFISKLSSTQSTEGYIFFTNAITEKERFIKRDNFVVRQGTNSFDLVDYIESFKEEEYPTLKDLSKFTKKRSDIEDFDTSTFTSVARGASSYQYAAFTTLSLGVTLKEDNQAERELSIGLAMSGTFLLFACFNYLGWVYFEMSKQSRLKNREV